MIIYKVINNINDKLCIGQTRNSDIKVRWKQHVRDSRKDNNIVLYKAFRKYGIENFSIEILCKNIDNVPQLNYIEKYFIAFLETNNSKKGYNCTEGGEGVQLFGEDNHNFGKKNLKLSEFNHSRKGQKLSYSHKENISKSNLGRKHSLESKLKMSEAKKKSWKLGVYENIDFTKK